MYGNQKIQKILACLILLLVPAFIFKEYRFFMLAKEQKGSQAAAVIENEYDSNKNKFFVICLEEFEVGEIRKKLDSIFDQNYHNFRVVFFYQNQNNLFYEKVAKYIDEKNVSTKVQLVKKEQEGQESPLFSVAKRCLDQEIVVYLDKQDWLINEYVLERLNAAYQDPDVWMIYSDYIHHPTNKNEGIKGFVNKNLTELKIYKTPWMQAHLRTCYAGLIKQIYKPNETQTNQDAASEKKQIFSLLKVARWHVKFIADPLSICRQ
jgi:hypothetical protein